ncbi:hypothetical protein D3C86_1156680 [compost metagenome]
MDPHRRTGIGLDQVGALLVHAHAQVFEHRQAQGQRDGLAGAEHLEAERARRGLDGPVQVHGEAARVLARVLHQLDVAYGGAGGVVLAVAGGEGVAVAAQQHDALFLAPADVERGGQVVLPAARGLHDARFQLARIHLGHGARLAAHGQLDARQRGFRQQRRELAAGAMERLHQQLLDALAQVGVVLVARHEDQARDKAVEAVAPHKEPDALVLLQPQDADGDLEQLVLVGLEQVIARILLEDGDQRLVQVALGQEAGARQDIGALAPRQRDLAGADHIGRGRVQPHEAPFAEQLAVGVEQLHAHIVEVAGPMHGRARVGLGQEDRRGPFDDARGGGGQRGQVVLARLAQRLAQDARARARYAAQEVLPVARHQLVVALAEEGEMVVQHPFEEGARLDRFRARGVRRVAHAGDGVLSHLLHARPVFHGGAHVAEDAGDAGAQRLQPGTFAGTVHLEMHERFEPAGGVAGRVGVVPPAQAHPQDRPLGVAADVEDRVDGGVERQAEPVDLHRDRIDEERHVVVDDLDDRMVRVPAVFLELRVVDPYARGAGHELLGGLPVGHDRAVEVRYVAREQVLGIGQIVVVAQQGLQQPEGGGGEPLARERDEVIQQLRDFFFVFRRHGISSACAGACSYCRKVLTCPGDKTTPAGR